MRVINYLFGERAYQRNFYERKPCRRIIGSYFIAALGIGFFNLCPLKYFSLIVLCGFLFPLLTDVVQSANRALWFALCNLSVGLLGIIFSIHLGLVFFQMHFEYLIFYALVLSGVLSVIRRYWNGLVWSLLDHANRHRGFIG